MKKLVTTILVIAATAIGAPPVVSTEVNDG